MRATDRIGFRPAALSALALHWLWRMGPVEPNAVEPDTGKHTRGPGPGWHGFWQRGANHSGFQPDESGTSTASGTQTTPAAQPAPGSPVGGDAPLPAKPANTASTPGNNAPCQANSDKKKKARKRQRQRG